MISGDTDTFTNVTFFNASRRCAFDKNNSWVNLTTDNLREEDFILAAGEEKSYWGNKVFRLTIGNKQGTDLILNGKSLVLPESSKGKVLKDFIIDSTIID